MQDGMPGMTEVTRRPEIATLTAPRPKGRRGAGPDFICIGAQKAGTRWLYDQLAFHPQFWTPPIKELHFFDGAQQALINAGRLQARIEKDLDSLNRSRIANAAQPMGDRDVRFVRHYLDLFKEKRGIEAYARLFDEKGAQKSGDVTPAYSKLNDKQVAKIVRRFPDAKVVFIIREPVERAWSALCMAARTKSWLKQPVTPASMLKFLNRKGVAGRAYPSRTVARWEKIARRDQFAWFFFDDLREDPADLRARVLRFLDADPGFPSGELEPGFNRKSTSAKLDLTDELHEALVNHFAEEVRRCADTLGGRAVEWRKKYNL